MILCRLIYTTCILILASCSPNTSKDNTKIQNELIANQKESVLKVNTHEQYAIIINLFQKSDTTFLEADYIQFLTGDKAIEAARKANEVDTFINKDGKIDFAVPNDYFIVNESKKIRLLPLSKDCIFDL